MLRSPLGRATLVVVGAHLLHDFDHVRQGRSATAEVALPGGACVGRGRPSGVNL